MDTFKHADSLKYIGLGLLAVALAGVFWSVGGSNNSEQSEDSAALQSSIDTLDFEDTEVPEFLRRSFPKADFTKVAVDTSGILSGGPGRDGIPSIDNPTFDEYVDSSVSDQVQAVVYAEGDRARVYPYSILNWHEIVNDTVDGVPIAVTFCPLCGSAIIFDRTTSAGVTEFGVSGGLLESNMIMYDRNTETFWQQATGTGIIGQLAEEELSLLPLQLLTVGEAKQKYPDGIILSTNTGFDRNYIANPYGDYDTNDRFLFQPSNLDDRYPPKQIFAALRVEGVSVAIPWLDLEDRSYNFTTQAGTEIVIDKSDGELNVSYTDGRRIPHYFEMWFSWAVQHQDTATAEVFDPSRNITGQSADE